MTRHLHLDLVGGIAGDMTVAALVDAGVPWTDLEQALRHSGLPLTAVRHGREWHGGLAGVRFDVEPEADPPARRWASIRDMLRTSGLSPAARDRALDVFERLAVAEGHVHGCAPDDVHFHEVGAMDSIVDIVAAAVCLEILGVSSASCGSVPVCTGSVRTAHGVLPLPAPATARLLQGFTLDAIEGGLETVTPTGAAILASLCTAGPSRPPTMRLVSTGVGLGRAELPDRPNVLRVLVGELLPSRQRTTEPDAVVIEASIDDMDPRLYGQVTEHLFEAGALDVALMPLQMKKGRPGTLLQVVTRPELEGVLSGIVLRETTTLGVRSHDVRRVELDRRHEPVETRFGTVRLKFGLMGTERVNVSPEYEDCAELARRHGVPMKDVFAAAFAAADALLPVDSRSGQGE